MPFDSPHTVIAASGRRLHLLAEEKGIAFTPLAQSVGIDPDVLARPDQRISLEAFMRLLQLIEIVSGDDCIGLRYAVRYQRGDSGPFGFAILHAPTLREAIRIYGTYQRIVADHTFFDIGEDAREIAIRWRYSRLLGYPEQYTDFQAGLLMKMLRSFMGADWYPRRVSLVRDKPRAPALHMAYFGISTGFAAAMNEVAFLAQALDAPSASADPRLFEMMEAACETALAAIERTKDLRLQVREHILAVLPMGGATLVRISKTMRIGERSLQRRLAAHGTRFETLVEQTRRDLSDRLLATDTPLAEISYLCGYSNASAYSRAAKGWYGVPPQDRRRALRA